MDMGMDRDREAVPKVWDTASCVPLTSLEGSWEAFLQDVGARRLADA